MPEESSGVWEGVRRALGRLIASARVREVSPERLAAVAVMSTAGLAGPVCLAGAWEQGWRPTARIIGDALPQAVAGAGGIDVAAVATVIGLSAALGPEAVDTFVAPPLPVACATHRLGAGGGLAATVHAAAVTLPPGSVRAADARFAAPTDRCLPMDPPKMARPERVRRLGRREPPAEAWRFADPRVRAGLAVIADVPLTRARRPLSPGSAAVEEASLSERRRLAETSGVALDDVLLLGVFPQVPVAAVHRLALEEGGGTLSLWLKPEALAHAAAGKSPRLATLVIGRQRSTGKILQTVA